MTFEHEGIASGAGSSLQPQGVEKVSDQPKAGQEIQYGDAEFSTVKEGLAYILTPKGTPTSTDPKASRRDGASVQSVFYNPIQQFNRDLSVLAIRAFGEDYLAAKQRKKEHRSTGRRNAKAKRKSNVQSAAGGVGEGIESEGPRKKRRKDEEANSGAIVVEDASETTIAAPPGDTAAVKKTSQEVMTSDGPGKSAQPTDQETDVAQEAIDAVSTEKRSSAAEGEVSNRKGVEQNNLRANRFTVLDALSATGLRALRYAQELPFVTSVTAVDLSRKATESIALNVEYNRLESKVQPRTGNALKFMYDAAVHLEGEEAQAKYHVIDLDPYGTAVPFLDAAVQALVDGGLLSVTCTDSTILSSNGYPEKTYSLYGGLPIKGVHSHEGGLRLVLHAIASAAARYGLAIEPLLSLSIDFYVRLFVRIKKSPAEVKFLAGKTMVVYNCDYGCGAWKTQFIARNQNQGGKDGTEYYKHTIAQAPTATPLCEHCNSKTHLAGPMYGGPIHNAAFIEKILGYLPTLDKDTYGTLDRIRGMLSTAQEELLVGDSILKAEAVNGHESQVKDRTEPAMTNGPSLIQAVHPATIDHHPFFFAPSALAKVLHCQAPSEAAIKSALRHAGFTAVRSHAKPGAVKSNAPWSFIWEVMREWVKVKAPIKEGAVKQGTAGWAILERTTDARAKEVGGAEASDTVVGSGGGEGQDSAGMDTTTGQKLKILFDENLGRDKASGKLVRYQVNPRPNWGPMNRAKGSG